MKKSCKAILSLFLVLLLAVSLASAAAAAAPSITFRGFSGGFDFRPGSEYTLTDLFDNFKNVMPGDSLTETITFTNSASDCDFVNLYLRFEPHDETANPLTYDEKFENEDGKDQADVSGQRDETVATMADFLSRLTMRIYNGTQLIFVSSPDQAGGLRDNRLLGTLRSGEKAALRVELDVPIDLGNVRLQSNYVEFDDVNKGDNPTMEIAVANLERTAYRPILMHLPPYLTAESVPADIPGGRTGVIRLTLNSRKLPQMGLNQTSVYLARYVGDKVSETNEIFVNAVLLPDFSRLTEQQKNNPPELQIETNEIDLGQMGMKEKLSQTIVLRNVGKSRLRFRQVQVFS